ncbi:hypothetical protein HRI_000660500 [Hibiscus trionum]|uniref:At2g35280-like TPR domain-containing protein n=1 Tax=Hibiscus trionum TaxID=183268 RepID=A0A9W7H3C1_HIBTR|nr:hypothetical protein HRI_000660500 [Hibiscus trionum]
MITKINNNIVRSLPKDLFSKILRQVASNSITGFVNARLCCKAFHRASNYVQIFKNVIMEKFNFVPWRKSETVFFERRIATKNDEALCREGMVDCFSRRKLESGLHCLKKMTEEGHVKAVYAYEIILICLGGDLRKQGLQIVSSLNLTNSSKRGSRTIANCHCKIEMFLSNTWVYFALPEPKQVDCNCDLGIRKNQCVRVLQKEKLGKQVMTWAIVVILVLDHETTLFCRVLRKYLVA